VDDVAARQNKIDQFRTQRLEAAPWAAASKQCLDRILTSDVAGIVYREENDKALFLHALACLTALVEREVSNTLVPSDMRSRGPLKVLSLSMHKSFRLEFIAEQVCLDMFLLCCYCCCCLLLVLLLLLVVVVVVVLLLFLFALSL
jgi:hypothetical protein